MLYKREILVDPISLDNKDKYKYNKDKERALEIIKEVRKGLIDLTKGVIYILCLIYII
jgi:hypothetical protein